MLLWLFNYLNCALFRGRFQPEQLICVQIRAFLLQQTVEGNIKHVWFHVPNEGYTESTAKMKMIGLLHQNMGKIAGVADYIFLGKDKSLALEVKAGKGKLSESQESFKKWCKYAEIPYHVAYSLEEVIALLKEEGILKVQS